jgi:hypothetical protein
MNARAWLAAPLVATVLLVGCSGGGDDEGGDTPTQGVAGTTSSATSETRDAAGEAPTATPTPTATATPTPIPCEASTVRITGLDKDGEIVTLEGAGNLTGWHIRSDRGGQIFYFPDGFMMDGTAAVQVFSGRAPFGDTATQLFWEEGNMWNNSDSDPAVLVCNGNEIQRFGS